MDDLNYFKNTVMAIIPWWHPTDPPNSPNNPNEFKLYLTKSSQQTCLSFSSSLNSWLIKSGWLASCYYIVSILAVF